MYNNKQAKKTTPSGHACCPTATPAVPPYRSCRRQSCCALPRLPHDKLLFLPLSGSLLTSTSRFVQPSPSQRLVALLPWSIETYDRQTSLAGWCSSREPGRGASLDGGWHRRCCATGATDSANPANPGSLGHCAARQPRLPNPLACSVTGELVAAVVPPGVMAAFPRLHPKACIRIA